MQGAIRDEEARSAGAQMDAMVLAERMEPEKYRIWFRNSARLTFAEGAAAAKGLYLPSTRKLTVSCDRRRCIHRHKSSQTLWSNNTANSPRLRSKIGCY